MALRHLLERLVTDGHEIEATFYVKTLVPHIQLIAVPELRQHTARDCPGVKLPCGQQVHIHISQKSTCTYRSILMSDDLPIYTYTNISISHILFTNTYAYYYYDPSIYRYPYVRRQVNSDFITQHVATQKQQ